MIYLIVRLSVCLLLGISLTSAYLKVSVDDFLKILFKNIRSALFAQGSVSREWFAATAVLLSIVKVSVDIALSSKTPAFGFWLTEIPNSLDTLKPYLPSLLWSLPFIWVGTGLTLMRLKDAGLARVFIPLFFVPILNFLFFLICCLLPSKNLADEVPSLEAAGRDWMSKLVPVSKEGVAAFAVVFSSILGILGVLVGAYSFKNYGGPLFLGVPFCMGFVSALAYGAREPKTLKQCVGVALASVVFTALALVCLLIEGIVCILGLFPIAATLAIVGAVLGYSVQALRPTQKTQLQCCSTLVLALAVGISLPVSNSSTLSTTTSIEIAAPASKVWQNVVAFSEIKAPREWLFLHGLAYPKRAHIEGTGVGAIRYCEFSTGPFIEPITIWNEPHELRFSVTKTPPALEEWNPLGQVIAPHLEGYFESLGGQFLLTETSPGHTRIDATTWYTHRVAPEWYWQLWSEPILHLIHSRVLEHIKGRSEEIS